ncbi:MAG: GDYXXLXY domain-containing protein, partial [Pirellulales bacterium]
MPESFTDSDRLEQFVVPAWVDAAAAWIKAHTRGLLAAGVLFQLLVLASMILLHAAPFVFGERIWLRVRPVDPRDPFRGDYVVLTYDFSRAP